MTPSRQLAAILFTDIVGYTAMMQEDETAAMAVVRNYTAVLNEIVSQHQGTIVNDYGDGNLCTFTSVTEALRCAITLQGRLQAEPKVPLRVGLHVGEIFFEDGKVFGDGVNVASRIQSLGVANSILFSAEIYSKINNQAEFKTVSLGSFHFKNVSAPMEVFALTAEGLTVPERKNMEGKLRSKDRSSKKWIAAAALVVVASGGFLYWKYLKPPNPESLRKSVAVLAFEDLSPGKDQAWFSDGISEEIINSLANLKELKVMARTSSFYFKGKDFSIAEIAEKLDVDHLVEGSVRRVDDQLRITVQLITKDGFHVFSETYDRPARDLLEVQNEIAALIAGKLIRDLNPMQVSEVRADKANSVEAFEFYLKGKAIGDRAAESEQFFWEVISIDPGFAPAYGRLADIYDTRGNVRKNRKSAWRIRDSLSQVGYKCNPTSPEVLYSRFLTFFKSESPNHDSAFYFLRKAHSLHPTNAFVNYFIGAFYVRLGMDKQAREFLNRSIELDPLNLVPRRWLGQHQALAGDLQGAEQAFRKLIELDSSISFDHRELARVYIMLGELEYASEELLKAEKLDGVKESRWRAMLFAAEGRKEEALKQTWDINVLSVLKMKRESLARLDSLTSDPSVNAAGHWTSVEKNPLFDFLRGDPEFKRIFDKVKKNHSDNLRKYGILN